MFKNQSNPLSASVALVANQLTGFYMRATLALNALNQFFPLLQLFYRAKQMTGFYISNATLGSNGVNLPFEKYSKK